MKADEVADLRGWLRGMTSGHTPGELAEWEQVSAQALGDIREGISSWEDEIYLMILSYQESMKDLLEDEPELDWGPGDSAMVAFALMLVEGGSS